MSESTTSTSTLPPSKPHAFSDLSWELSHGVRVRTHRYDDTLYAFEITQHDKCLGTLIPNTIGDMERIKYVLDNDLPLDGYECNDEFKTIIKVDTKQRVTKKA
jgi:DNA-directed RNA polymerase subunit L